MSTNLSEIIRSVNGHLGGISLGQTFRLPKLNVVVGAIGAIDAQVTGNILVCHCHLLLLATLQSIDCCVLVDPVLSVIWRINSGRHYSIRNKNKSQLLVAVQHSLLDSNIY
jgi:hypothetical protein